MKSLFKKSKEKKPLLNDKAESSQNGLPIVSTTYNAVTTNDPDPEIRNSIMQRFGDDYSRSTLISAVNTEEDFESFESYSKSGSALTFAAVAFLIYYVVGAIFFHELVEDWTIIDSAYMASVTFTTCGYGDLTPTEDGNFELTFMIIYVLVGVLVLATLAFNLVFENLFDGYDSIMQSNKEKNQQELIENIDKIRGGTRSVADAKTETKSGMLKDMGGVIISSSPLFIILILGSLLIGKVEGWDFMKSMYFLVVTATSVGYGDVSPQTQSMRFFCIFFIPVSVGIMAETFGRLAGVYLAAKGEEKQREFFSRQLTFADIERMDEDGDEKVSKEEFIKFMLIALGKISEEDWGQLDDLFDRLDDNGDGCLSYEDVLNMVEQSKASMSPGKKARKASKM